MAETVKLKAIKALEDAIKRVSGVAQVVRSPAFAIEQETARFPLIFLWEESEQKERVNRLARARVSVQVQIWHRSSELDAVDELAGKIEKALLTDETVARTVSALRPDPERSAVKLITDEFLVGCVLGYVFELNHVWADPFDDGR